MIEKTEIIYVFDPLCGWCYGFAPVMQKIEAEFRDRAAVSVIAGGMIIGELVGPIGRMAGVIKEGNPRITEMSGVEFGEAFDRMVDEGSTVLNSLPPSRALAVCKELRPGQALEFTREIQNLFFKFGKDLGDIDVLAKAAVLVGIAENEFQELYHQDKYNRRALEDFQYSRDLGVTGFPTVLLKKHDRIKTISRGLQAFEPLKEALDKEMSG